MKKQKLIAMLTAAVMMAVSLISVFTVSSAVETPAYYFAEQVAALVNEERIANGLSPLKMSNQLNSVASLRSEELTTNFSHERPDGTTCNTALDEAGISYTWYGENIAYGYNTPEAVMNCWMNSDGHRENILSSDFEYIGVGISKSGSIYYWTQMFIASKTPMGDAFYPVLYVEEETTEPWHEMTEAETEPLTARPGLQPNGDFIVKDRDSSLTTVTAGEIENAPVKPEICVDTVSAYAGETVEVKVSINGTTDWAATAIHVNYDPALELVSYEYADDVYRNVTCRKPVLYDTEYYTGVFFTTASMEPAGINDYAVLTFKAPEKPDKDFYSVTVLYVEGDICTNAKNDFTGKIMTAYAFTKGITNGGIVVEEPPTEPPTTVATAAKTTAVAVKTTEAKKTTAVIKTTSKAVRTIQIIPETLIMSKGDTNQLLAVTNIDSAVRWTSGDTSVAAVSSDGLVTAKNAGTATIYAVCGDKIASCVVNVKDSSVIYGDADDSGEVNIADAVSIVSYLADSERYPIAASQLDASDVSNRGDGVNSADAIAVQRFLLGDITSLPESYMK